MEDVLPVEVREFASRNLDSVAQLEALLLMRREREVDWTIHRLAKRLYINEADSLDILTSLHARGLLIVSRSEDQLDSYKYAPASSELDRLVTATEDSHARYLIPLTQFVHAKTMTTVQQFANAFRFKEKSK